MSRFATGTFCDLCNDKTTSLQVKLLYHNCTSLHYKYTKNLLEYCNEVTFTSLQYTTGYDIA